MTAITTPPNINGTNMPTVTPMTTAEDELVEDSVGVEAVDEGTEVTVGGSEVAVGGSEVATGVSEVAVGVIKVAVGVGVAI